MTLRSDFLDSLGEVGVHVLPSNQSTIFGDSKFRQNPASTVTNFTMKCDRVRMKEFYYSTLYWKQSLYTHNCSNCEVIYQFQYGDGNESPIYVCYAMPFVTYTSYDGNPAGSVFAEPNPDKVSYARQMEFAFNQDCRLYATNSLVPTSVSTFYQDTWAGCPAGGLNVFFRYNSSKGFAFWAAPKITPPVGSPSVYCKILQCDWVKNGHTVHGFGYPYPIYQPANYVANNVEDQLPPVYGPDIHFLPVYYAESLPTLLPLRYIAILSPELTKDRRIPSFHSGNVNSFNNEIAIFGVELKNSGVWHTDIVNEDSTVVSIRENYSPQQITFIMVNDDGKNLQVGQNLSNCINEGLVDPNLIITMLSGIFGGNRAHPYIMNRLIFNTPVISLSGNPTTYTPIATQNIFGPYDADIQPDDICHELVAIIRDN